jgi:hypothetical protein
MGGVVAKVGGEFRHRLVFGIPPILALLQQSTDTGESLQQIEVCLSYFTTGG